MISLKPLARDPEPRQARDRRPGGPYTRFLSAVVAGLSSYRQSFEPDPCAHLVRSCKAIIHGSWCASGDEACQAGAFGLSTDCSTSAGRFRYRHAPGTRLATVERISYTRPPTAFARERSASRQSSETSWRLSTSAFNSGNWSNGSRWPNGL